MTDPDADKSQHDKDTDSDEDDSDPISELLKSVSPVSDDDDDIQDDGDFSGKMASKAPGFMGLGLAKSISIEESK